VSFPDPYPQDDINIIGSVDDTPDDLKLPEGPDDRVYPDSRYTKGNSPYCIYIPCREIMLKLMRACIKVKHAEHLWVMKDRPPERGTLKGIHDHDHGAEGDYQEGHEEAAEELGDHHHDHH